MLTDVILILYPAKVLREWEEKNYVSTIASYTTLKNDIGERYQKKIWTSLLCLLRHRQHKSVKY